jgi:hypothetical protein
MDKGVDKRMIIKVKMNYELLKERAKLTGFTDIGWIIQIEKMERKHGYIRIVQISNNAFKAIDFKEEYIIRKEWVKEWL